MNIRFFTIDADPPRWGAALQQHLPQARITIHPDHPGAQADYAVCWKPPVHFFDGQQSIKVVFNIAAGVDYILAHPAMQSGYLRDVPIVRLGDAGMAVQMEEYVLAAALRWQRKLDTYAAQQRAGQWIMLPPVKREHVTVGVLGLGVLGAYVAQSMQRFGFAAAGWSQSAKQIDGVDCYAGERGLADMLARTHLLVCLLPLTESTRGILNRANLSTLPQGAHLINIGRGAHLAENDLIPLLDSGHLEGATLDVFAQEPLPAAHPFWTHPKVRITPHVSASTMRDDSMAQIAEKILAFERGEALAGVVDRTKGY